MSKTEEFVEALRASMKENERLRQENRRLTEAATEPIAVIGMACRFCGGIDSPEQLWRLLDRGDSVRVSYPEDRGARTDEWYAPDPAATGRSYARYGGFLSDVGDFDAEFFGLSHVEATAMDPHQRLLLEVSWEAIERAGIGPHSLRHSDTGVFVGATHAPYPLVPSPEPDDFGLTSNNGSVLSGRIAYQLGLTGPALTVDTACSSSLVALHLAVRSLRSGECTLALAGGVCVMTDPRALVELAHLHTLSADGRCKSFAAGADGTGFAEGASMLLMERLSDARRHGHRVLAVVRGSAVNHDGPSNGLMAPNGPAQQRLIRRALDDARLSAAEVDVVEAHGTGTILGDSIEANALLATYGRSRTGDQPLWLGALKANIGHTQAASGVAGVIKTVLAMRHGVLPATPRIDAPTPEVDWSSGGIALLTARRPWQAPGRPRRAAVSAFGVGGTNAHVILEEAAPVPDRPSEPLRPLPVTAWVLSAHSSPALAEQAGRLRAFAEERAGTSVLDIAWSLATTRSVMDHRAVVWGTDRTELLAGLRALEGGRTAANVVTGARLRGKPAIVFGSCPWPANSAAELAEAFPAISEPLSLAHDRNPSAPEYTFAVELGVHRLLEALAVRPSAVAGWSRGRILAAHVSGALPLPDSLRLLAAGDPRSLDFTEPRIPLVCDRSGARLTRTGLTAPGHWADVAADTESLARGLGSAGASLVIDLAGALPTDPVREGLTVVRTAGSVTAVAAVTEILASLFVGGCAPDWTTYYVGRGARTVELPTYAFQRRRYWAGYPESNQTNDTSLG
ncbi:type I polyketide synthase [Streptomyces sp. NPDC048483]|uniref:type I polyketide synthase n=1 Tax=Streptomyces sp. NPDC048483 TaxID=3154927 RepID=UPI0034342431